MAKLHPKYRKKDGSRRLSGFYAVFYNPARHPARKWVTLRTKNKRTARRRIAALERKEAGGTWDPWDDAAPQKGTLLSEAVEAFLKSRKRSGAKPQTLKTYREHLEHFAGTLPPDFQLRHVERRHVEEWALAEGDPNRQLAAASQATYLRHARAFLAWCQSEGLAKRNAADGIPDPAPGRKVPQFLSRRQYRELLRTIEADATMKARSLPDSANGLWFLPVVKVATFTGFRRGVLCRLQWRDVDLAGRNVTARKTKNSDERAVPLREDAGEALRELHTARASEDRSALVLKSARGKPLRPKYVSTRFKHYARLAGLPESISFHNLRHTFGSWLAQAGVSAPQIQELMGHRRLSSTQKYMHHSPQSLGRAMDAAFGEGNPSRSSSPSGDGLDAPKRAPDSASL